MTATNAIIRQEPTPSAGREPGPCTQPAAPEAKRKEGLRDRRAAALARKYVWWQDPCLTLLVALANHSIPTPFIR